VRVAVVAMVAVFTLGSGTGFSRSLETIVVTAARLEDENRTPMSVVSREAIARYNPATTTDLLRRIPHVLISDNGPGGHSFVSVRGGEPNFTLIMIDGVTVNDPTNSRGGAFDFNQLDPSVIERVEVYRGGVSALYGGEAISGVIHIITRIGGRSALALEGGIQSARRGSLTLSKEVTPGVSALLGLNWNRRDESASAQYENRQALLKLAGDFDSMAHTLLVSVTDQDATAFGEDSGGALYADPLVPEDRESRQYLAGYTAEYQPSKRQRWIARVSWSRHEEEVLNPGIADGALSGIPPSNIRSDYRRSEAELFVDWRLTDSSSLLAGVNGKVARGENKGTLPGMAG